MAIYLLNRHDYKEPEKDRTNSISEPQYALFNPRFLAFALMALNAVTENLSLQTKTTFAGNRRPRNSMLLLVDICRSWDRTRAGCGSNNTLSVGSDFCHLYCQSIWRTAE